MIYDVGPVGERLFPERDKEVDVAQFKISKLTPTPAISGSAWYIGHVPFCHAVQLPQSPIA